MKGAIFALSLTLVAGLSLFGSRAFAAPVEENLALNKVVVGSIDPARLKNLVDGKANTFANLGNGGWFSIDLGAPMAIGRAFLLFTNVNGALSVSKTVKFSVSDDGKTWKEIFRGCDCSPNPEHVASVDYAGEIFFAPVTARYFRADLPDAYREFSVSLDEFELYDPESSSPNLALGKPALSSSNAGSGANKNVPWKTVHVQLTDNDVWKMLQFYGPTEQVVIIDLGSAVAVNRLRVNTNHHGPNQHFEFFGSEDNGTWTKLFTVAPPLLAKSLVYASYSFKSTNARYIKGVFLDRTYPVGQGSMIGEIYVYGPITSKVPMSPVRAVADPAKTDGGAALAVDAGRVSRDADAVRTDVATTAADEVPLAPREPAVTNPMRGADGGASASIPQSADAQISSVSPSAMTESTASGGCTVAGLHGRSPRFIVLWLFGTCALVLRLPRRRTMGRSPGGQA